MKANIELPPLLNYAEGVRLKQAGMLQAATSDLDASEWLTRAQGVARYLAAKDGEKNIEIVYGVVGLPPRPNVAGSVFRGKGWKCIGTRQAMRVKRHAGLIRRWALI